MVAAAAVVAAEKEEERSWAESVVVEEVVAVVAAAEEEEPAAAAAHLRPPCGPYYFSVSQSVRGDVLRSTLRNRPCARARSSVGPRSRRGGQGRGASNCTMYESIS